MDESTPDCAETRSLLDEAGTGNRRAFERLFARHRPGLRSSSPCDWTQKWPPGWTPPTWSRTPSWRLTGVYGVGCERGVHFYAMQFIDGQTLAVMVDDLRRQAGSGAAPPAAPTGPYTPAPETGAAQAAATPPAAGRSTQPTHHAQDFFGTVAHWGGQAAEALEHAHQLGVVHRDIKPANLLLDARGNLWITDFGLAHCQSQAGLTMSGDLVGTLRYMSPEQALAKRVIVDHRTDIYSLGATLYELLTLEPAFDGRDREELLRQIAFEEPKPPRRLNKAIPAELETIVLKAIEKNPAERYATAQELADDLERYLKDEPIRAKRPTLVQRVRRWARRRKPVVVTAAAGLILALAVLSGSIGWIVNDRTARYRELTKEVEGAMSQAADFQKAGNWPEGRGALQRARSLLATVVGDERLRQHADDLLADLNMAARLEEIRLERAAAKNDDFDFRGADAGYAKAFQDYGIDVEALTAEQAADRIRQKPIRAELAAALDDWALTRQHLANPDWKKLLVLARAVDPNDDDGRRNVLRQALERGDAEALRQMAADGGKDALSPSTALLLAAALKSRGFPSSDRGQAELALAAALLHKTQQQHPDDFWVNHELASILDAIQPPRWEEAIGFYRAAVALRSRSAGVYSNLGNALQSKGDLPAAIAAHQRAIALSPDSAVHHINLGTALLDNGRLDEAMAEYHEAIRLKKHFPQAHYGLAKALSAKGRLDEAIAEYQEAIRLQKDYAEAHNNLGNALRHKGDLAGAIVAHQKAIAVKPDYAEAHSNLGNTLLASGDLAGALAALQKATFLKPNLAEAHFNFGVGLGTKGDLAGAIVAYRKAIALKPEYAEPRVNLGLALRDKGRLDEAIDELQEAIRLKKDFAEAHYNLGNAFYAKGRLDEAIDEVQEAIRLKKDFAEVHHSLGTALHAKGRLDEAIGEYQKAIRLKKDHAEARYNLGVAYYAKGRLDEAIAEYQEAMRLKKDYAEAHYNLGHAYYAKGRPDEAIAEWKDSIRVKDYAEAHCNLGVALRAKGRLDEAIAEYQEAIRLKKETRAGPIPPRSGSATTTPTSASPGSADSASSPATNVLVNDPTADTTIQDTAIVLGAGSKIIVAYNDTSSYQPGVNWQSTGYALSANGGRSFTDQGALWLDDNAAGWGWFVDPTPCDHSEFTTPGNQREQHHMDLLAVPEHEIGHVLGRE